MSSDPLATQQTSVAGIPGFPGPFAVGRYAARLREKLREFAHVCVIGEVTGVRIGRGPERLLRAARRRRRASLRDVARRLRPLGLSEATAATAWRWWPPGGCDYYPGGASGVAALHVPRRRSCGWPARATCSPGSRGCGAQLAAEGLFERQKLLARPGLRGAIGVVTAEGSAARRDFLAGLERRCWRGHDRLGLRAGAGSPCRAGHRRRDSRPGGGRRGRGHRRHPRRRQHRRPLGVLRRDALPHGRAHCRCR